MPQSKNRSHRHQHHNHPAPPVAKPKKQGRAAIVSMILFAILGLGVGYFTAGDSIYALATAAGIGAVAGYLFGHLVDKSIDKK